ncbi:HtaA domain-containing protein [Glutamicibacter sp. MNS18]|uniref:HtaA domain-containing protein n=1 Tax=Glutamicibacter sp. MNS18 TaxID=2989817 RepID=UPI0022355E66|nr:HtaA domain-containing protein [Glutamicibacter sp. MNS18]MCW4465924.1 HtaA domain-containing protein [Glutamicibacter sp. MNS18]
MSARKTLATLGAIGSLVSALLLPAVPAHADASGEEKIDVKVTIPAPGTFEVTDAQFRWGVNDESTSPAHEPGRCNFLSAGVVGDAGSSHTWTEKDGFFKTADGNTRIERPGDDGQWATETWDTRCTAPAGRAAGTGTGGQVVIDKGTGSIDVAKGTAEIAWDGSFSIVFYDGRTYWSISDPVLQVANGKGTMTATASGYASDREDSTRWQKVPETTITMADLPDVTLGQNGIITTPAYKGVKLSDALSESMPQATTGDWWGSFPESWVKFNQATGQGAFWYSSGGLSDKRKVATDVYISYTPDNPVLEKPETGTPQDTDSQDDLTGGNTQNSNGDTTSLVEERTSITNNTTNFLQPAAGALMPPLAELAGAGTSVLEAATIATSAINWLGKSLIPDAIERVMDYRQPLLWSLAGLLALASVAWVGFRRGWLVWPFASKQKDQNTDS